MTRASGKARRWPDLLIGLLVLLLLAGFAFLLVGQRAQPVAQAPTPTPPATEAAPGPITIPSAPGTGTTVEPPGATAPSAPEESAATSPPADGTETPAPPASANAGDTTDAPSTTEIPVVPAAPIEEAPPGATTAATPEASGPGTTTPGTTTAPTTPPATATPPQAAGPVATSEQRTPLRSDYRVSLGSFATRRTAERLTQGVSDLGYTVYPIDLGDQVVAQIGPFPDEATARRALADIQRAYPGAVLYPPRGRSLRGESSETTAPPASAPAPSATPSTGPDAGSSSVPAPAAPAPAPASPAPETASPPEALPTPVPSTPAPPVTTEPKAGAPSAPSGPVYLQLGAFDRVESAQSLVTRLRGEGYAPTVNAPDGRKVTVLVGPFSGAALSNAETNLAANGHEFFRVR